MKVFASAYLEGISNDEVNEEQEWSWTPNGKEAHKIYASGANTSTRQSTYADERDDRSDSDRPNEGMYVA